MFYANRIIFPNRTIITLDNMTQTMPLQLLTTHLRQETIGFWAK